LQIAYGKKILVTRQFIVVGNFSITDGGDRIFSNN
jgi:hypothetical protein